MVRVIFFFLLIFLSQGAVAFSYTLEISEAELQEKVSAMMPMEKKKFFITVVLSDPEVDLIEGRNEVGIFSHIEVKAPGGVKGTGRVKIEGSLSYDPDKAEFYFKNPSIIDIEVDSIPEKYHSNIKKLAQTIADKALVNRPVYKLKDDNLKHKLAKSVLESILVEDEELHVKLSAF